MPRFHVDLPLSEGAEPVLPADASRHVQVLRLQPGADITLFDGRGGEWQATVLRIGRHEVQVRIGAWRDVRTELSCHVTLALGVPANDRMDTLVEKATELGVMAIQPLMCERAVLRLAGERAAKRVAHWHAVAASASEQSGRTRVPLIAPVCGLHEWLAQMPPNPAQVRLLLSLTEARPLDDAATLVSATELVCLSGPEGGLTDAEEAAARAQRFSPVTLGPRVLRADTAPLALLAHLGLCGGVASRE